MGVSSGSGSSNFNSSPINLQNPEFTGLAGDVATGLRNLWNNGLGAGGFAGFSPWSVGGTPSGNVNNWGTDPAGTPENPLVSPMGVNERGDLNTLTGLTSGSVPGQGNALLQTAGSAATNMLDPNYAANLATSPVTQNVISSAIQPLKNTFAQTTMPALRGQATAAGQRTGGAETGGGAFNAEGGGSSAFDARANEATNNLMAQEGQVAGNITGSTYQTGLQQQSGAITQANQLGTGEINNVLSDLQAQSLPRLVQQYGINQGLSLYNNSVSSLLQALGLGGQVAQPAIGYNSSGSGSSKNMGVSGLPKLF